MSVRLKPGVKYEEILNNEDLLVDVHMLVKLFKSVSPKLDTMFEQYNKQYVELWNELKSKLEDDKTDWNNSEMMLLGVEIVYKNRYQGFIRNIESFKEVSEKLADKLMTHISSNQKELLCLMIESSSLIPSILDLFKDVDKLQDEISLMFGEMSEFLCEVSSHIQVYDGIRREI